LSTIITLQPRREPNKSYPLSPLARVSDRMPCPVCQKTDWCEIRADGAVHCMRVVSQTEATRGGGYWHNLPNKIASIRNKNSQHNATYPDKVDAGAILEPGAAEPDTLDKAYRILFRLLPVSPEHRDWLLAKGVEEHQLSNYASVLPAACDICQFAEVSQAAIDWGTIPGFYRNSRGELCSTLQASLLCAVQDAQGRIIGVQMRIESGDTKRYVWLSSASRGGPSSGSPAHVSVPKGFVDKDAAIWFTEGARKASIVTNRLGVIAVGMAGHSQIRSLFEVCRILVDDWGMDRAVVALDEDQDAGVASLVDASRQKLINYLRFLGLTVRVARWSADQAKGIDDLLLARRSPKLELCTGGIDSLTPSPPTPHVAALSTAIEAAMSIDASPIHKLALIDTYVAVGLPGEGSTSQQRYIGDCAARLGCSDKVAGTVYRELAASGLVERSEEWSTRDDGRPYRTLSFAPANLPQAGVSVSRASSRDRDALRKKQCVGCGASHFGHYCVNCGMHQEVEPVSTIPSTEETRPCSAESAAYTTISPETCPTTLFPIESHAADSANHGQSTNLVQPCPEEAGALECCMLAVQAQPRRQDELAALSGLDMGEVSEWLNGMLDLRKLHVLKGKGHGAPDTYAWGRKPDTRAMPLFGMA
jgi:Domain of unknown function (DUF3854)